MKCVRGCWSASSHTYAKYQPNVQLAKQSTLKQFSNFRHIKISLPLVLLDKVKIIPTNNDGPVHLSTVACSSNDATPDRHSASERAFLINVGSCNKLKIKISLTEYI